MARYIPPKQSKIGQMIDVVVLLILSIGALYIPLWLGLAGSSKLPLAADDPTWEGMGQNEVMVERWIALGCADPVAAHDLINARFDYSFTLGALALMVIVIVGYFAMILKLSEQEYRDVIAEKFDGK